MLVLIPTLQLIPVPPAVWTNLPGRENVVAAISFIGRADEWRPMSIAPGRTVASLLSLIPPVAMMWFACRLKTREQTMLLWVVAGVGLVSAVVATLQVTTGDTFIFYQAGQATRPPGIMASRNAQADLLLFAMLATIALAAVPDPRASRSVRMIIAGLVLVVLVTALILSGSRAGVAMLFIPVIAGFRLWYVPAPAKAKLEKRRWLVIGTGALVALAGLGLVARDNAMVNTTLDRFSASTDARFSEIWPDAVEAARVMWPAGGGMGTFIPAFESVESLEVVNTSNPNRAHNDYLEFIIEAGLAGVLLLVAVLTILLWRIVKALGASRGRPAEPVIVFAAAALLVVAFHSLVDYPLRAMAIAVTAGLAVGSLSRRKPEEKRSRVDA
ncbi:O-antigen ligase family protein [Roseibium sp.]|uniref:O-antigen ligase family protein n=1 Tax=Roseibium sp. TaxID=1936156 RepID=UPI003298EDF0